MMILLVRISLAFGLSLEELSTRNAQITLLKLFSA